MTEADVKPPGMEPSPLRLQTWCLRAPNQYLARLSLQEMIDLLKTVGRSQPPKLSQVTNEKPISKASGVDGEQLQKGIMDDLNKNTLSSKFLQNRSQKELWDGSRKSRRRRRRNKGWSRNGAGLARESSRSLSVAGNPKPTIPKPAYLEDYRNLGSPQKKEVKKGDADAQVSQENQELAR